LFSPSIFSSLLRFKMRILLLFLMVYEMAYGSCPGGFEVVEGECRGVFTMIPLTLDVALSTVVSKCQGVLGAPLIIHNDEQQSYWTSRTNTNLLVLGLVCNSNSKEWEWVDGSKLDFKPSNHDAALDQQCKAATDWWVQPNGKWHLWTNGGEVSMVDIACTTPIRQPVPSADGCDSFEDDSEDGVCYQIGATAESWQDAQMNCKHLGANLASIHSQQENSFVRRLAVSKGAINGLFLGATIAGKGKDFGWVDGSEWDFEYFYPGFPIPASGDCLAMDTSTSSGQWMNFDCSQKLPVACIRPQKEVTDPACSTGPWAEGTIISSPGFPYDSSTPCDFFLSVDEGKIIEAEIVFLEANPCCDHLAIHDRFLGEGLIANITGEVRNVTYTSTSNLMRVSWQPNGGENVRGMAISYRGV
ncbi:hypothetical protein PENTCL1PPCAC_4084, partial [Pristionchus entomophagus]